MAEEVDETRPGTRLAFVGGFIALCALIFGFLWVNSGGRIPFTGSGYEVTATMPAVSNTVYFSDVMIAGVKVGKVREVKEHGTTATVKIELNEDVAPLHEGATFQIKAKSLVEESYVDVTDGKGAKVSDGHVFPVTSAKEPVALDDLLNSLDAPTRASLTSLVRSSGIATKDSQQEVSEALEGLGDLGREGGTALDALADQSADLQKLTRSSTQVLTALAQRREQLSSLVTAADAVTEATAGQQEDLAATIRALPPVLETARAASGDLTRLATNLSPIAKNLEAAAPDLSAALKELPATSADLRGLLPSLDAVLDKSPETLTKIPTFSGDLESILPPAEAVLADLNPTLGYLEPYGRDLAAWFTNFSQTIATGDVNGRAFRVMVVASEQSFKGIPFSTNLGPLDRFNAMPGPGTLQNPGPAREDYPRVEREPVPGN